MALVHSALALLVAVTCVHAARQPKQPFCLERPFRGPCQEVHKSWYYDCTTNKCYLQGKVLCASRLSTFLNSTACLACKSSSKQMCQKHKLVGRCTPIHHRWYYEPNDGRCRPFSRGECSTGGNHFPSEQACKEACVPGVPITPPRCLKPVVLGLCRLLSHSWHFDVGTRNCVMYPQGQCGSGPNVFVSQNKCSTACNQPSGKQLAGCLIPPKILGCEATQPAWMFDPRTRTCKMFLSGACGRGMNHFNSEVECRRTCLQLPNAIPVCSAKPTSAYCLGYGTYWYFDVTKNDCFRFEGGWCGKNANGFMSYSICRDICSYSARYLPPTKQGKPPQRPFPAKPGNPPKRPLPPKQDNLPQPLPPTNPNSLPMKPMQQISRPK